MLSFVALTFVYSCDGDEEALTESQIDTSQPILNSLDIWLRDNFVDTYNIDILYQWDIYNVAIGRYLHPPYLDNVQPLAEAITKTWIEPYNEVGGEDFIKNLAPREFVFSGGFNYNPDSPTITLGIAEQGARITFFNIDELVYDNLDYNSLFSVVSPIQTMHHEYLHILNQTVPYDPIFEEVNPEGYLSNWTERSDSEAREDGFITAYAGSQAGEDFAEMVSQMLTRSNADWNALVDSISSEEAKENIRRKELLVVEYYQNSFDINFYDLQVLTYDALINL